MAITTSKPPPVEELVTLVVVEGYYDALENIFDVWLNLDK